MNHTPHTGEEREWGDCAELSCATDCTREHTHHHYFCERCKPSDTTPNVEKMLDDTIHWSKTVSGLNLSDHHAEELRVHMVSILTQAKAEERARVEELQQLLKECEPFLSDGSGIGTVNMVYVLPAEQLRRQASRIEYEAELKARVRKALTALDTNTTEIH